MAGRISTGGTTQGRGLNVNIRVEGVDRTSDEFKQARKSFNTAIREVMVQVGNRTVLPQMRSEMRQEIGNRWADSLYVQRERSGVFVGSRQRGPFNRALGWLDFGGQRPLDTSRRTGPHVMVRVLDDQRELVDDAVLAALLETFRPLDTSKTL